MSGVISTNCETALVFQQREKSPLLFATSVSPDRSTMTEAS